MKDYITVTNIIMALHTPAKVMQCMVISYLGLLTRIPVIGVSEKASLQPFSSANETN